VGEVALDSPGGDEQGLGDLAVGEPFGGQLRYAALAGGECFEPAEQHPARLGSGGAQLGLGPSGQRGGAEAVGGVDGLAERVAGLAALAMLFDGWPAARLPPAPARALTLALTALVALALDRALAAYADSIRWTRATPNEWITTAALSFIGAGIILHVGIGLRWPFARKTTQQNP
jgi:hypothetical protein